MSEGLLQLEHEVAPAPRKLAPSAYDLAKAAFFLFGLPRNGFGSVDVTRRCNLRCRHCYYFAADAPAREDELSDEQWVARFEELRRSLPRWEFPFFNCSWVGGEPLLRKELLARCMRFFRYNTIVTNGTIPLPDWPRVNWYVSIDGTAAVHESIRDPEGHFRKHGRGGIYERVQDNVRRNRHLGITIAYCITRDNAHCLEEVVKEWHALGAKHITFDFMTPRQGADDPQWLPFDERDRVIEQLVALRRVYGSFFVVPERVFTLMRSASCRRVTDGCLLRTRSFAFDAGGRQKGKCVMGDEADCDRCGCVVPFYLRSLTDREAIIAELGRDALVGGLRLKDEFLARLGRQTP